MKRTLYLKLLGGYLLFGLLGFLIIATFTYHLTFQHLEKKEAQNLYRESALISSSYAQNYFSNSMTLDEINEQLSALDTYLNADIWIVDTHGKILINTAATETTEETIPDFYDPNGNSLFLIHTNRGEELFEKIRSDLDYRLSNTTQCWQANLEAPTQKSEQREEFWNDYKKKGIDFVMKKYGTVPVQTKIKNKILKIFRGGVHRK